MALYYFDLRDGEELALDEESLELRAMRAVQEEAARALRFRLRRDALGRRAKPKPTDGNRGARRARPCDGSQVVV